MSLPKEVLVYAIGLCNGDPVKSATLIKGYEAVRDSVYERNRKIEKIRKNAESEIAKLMSVVLCKHDCVETKHDPSGGSDRSNTCLICGEILNEPNVRFT
jgi:hypothetical protein